MVNTIDMFSSNYRINITGRQKPQPVFCLILLCLFGVGINTAIAQKVTKPTEKTRFDSSLFTDVNVLTQSDYLSALQKVFEIQNQAPVISNSFTKVNEIIAGLADADSAIKLIQQGFSSADNKSLNLQDLQMFDRLLSELNDNTDGYKKVIDQYEKSLNGLKSQIAGVRKDTVLRHIFSNPQMRETFKPQIAELRDKWEIADSLVRLNTTVLNNVKTHISANLIAINELAFKTSNFITAAGINAFTKERRYLWEPRKFFTGTTGFQKEVETEKKITSYYFKNIKGNRLMLWLLSVVFFYWIFYNFKTLKRLKKLTAVEIFAFKYITPYPILASLIFILSIAPMFDLDAPVIYTDSIAFASVIMLTLFFIKRLPHPYFYYWLGYVALFLMLPVLDVLGLPLYMQRWSMLIVSLAGVVYSIFIMFYIGKKAYRFKYIMGVGILYVVLNVLSIVCNMFGRVTLSQIFYSTAAYALFQAIALKILIQIVIEAFLLQIAGSRTRKRYPEQFESGPIVTGVSKVASIIATVLWFVVLADNLNVFDTIVDRTSVILQAQHIIGSFSFTLGGIILFSAIIWVANFLQKNIGSFFGDIGDDTLTENKSDRSRLLVTRLILLILGFLLAVAASGLPVDKITVILGALGVGIGLGLQNIVNNFVSGIILIFDRTLRIGDVVELSDKKGRVKEIGIRASTLLTADGAEVVIPNGDILSKNIINWTLSNNIIRVTINLTITRPFNMDDVASICSTEILANKNVYTSKPPELFITAITPANESIKVLFWCKNISQTEKTYSEVYSAIYEKLGAAGITLV